MVAKSPNMIALDLSCMIVVELKQYLNGRYRVLSVIPLQHQHHQIYKEMDTDNVGDPSQDKKYKGVETSANPIEASSQDKEEAHHHCCDCCLQKTIVNSDHCSSSSAPQSDGLGCSKSGPFGWIFRPTDLEIVTHFLPKRILNQPMRYNPIIELDLYKEDPLEILEKYKDSTVGGKLYFFTQRQRKYPNGDRPKRIVLDGRGLWKLNGKSAEIQRTKGGPQIGARQQLDYYQGPKPKTSDKTGLKIDEYLLETKKDNERKLDEKVVFHEWALCRMKILPKKEERVSKRKQRTAAAAGTWNAGEENDDGPVAASEEIVDMPDVEPAAAGTEEAGEEIVDMPDVEPAAAGTEEAGEENDDRTVATSEEIVDMRDVEPAAAGKGNAGRLVLDLNLPYIP
ncbi:hypothetical protein MKW98_020107 [Papaver atlanticum]|uniref:NAC domain-containing protein n=1 Tax=Papaver atlanticum TaxID=357466 RepID=A0AAD4X7E1_9MAGN|nr:hypothetical protein MKW98_020107 [Papaver atlanticum]